VYTLIALYYILWWCLSCVYAAVWCLHSWSQDCCSVLFLRLFVWVCWFLTIHKFSQVTG
jgi:hypothetical protein